METIAQNNKEDEEFPRGFECCICLELLHKPVVLGCGHIACFWCIFKAMKPFDVSACADCRVEYHHFPAVCRLMHFLLVKLYPLASKSREKQVAEEEKVIGYHSPTDVISDNVKFGDRHTNASRKQLLMTDFLCSICKQLLCRPVVLNCGHVYCKSCVVNDSDKLCRCPVCQLEHPNGYPSICLVLQDSLKEQFHESYVERERASVEIQIGSTGLTKTQEEATSHSSPGFEFSEWYLGRGPKVHFGFGCDNCGMSPIVGDRYKCKDCREEIGFDLCEGCYKIPSECPGRFNQQHTSDHKFEEIQPIHVIRNVSTM